jgi:CBS domain-containing protein
MARNIEEIMNREVFSLRPDDAADAAVRHLLALGINGAPVTDGRGRVVGHASLRDLLSSTVAERMTTSPEVARIGTTIEEAGRQMIRHRVHRLIVVDDDLRAVGVASLLDVTSALLGMPVVHPPAFSHFDRALGVTWTDEAQLTLDSIASAPDGSGVFVLIRAEPGKPDQVVWSEGVTNVRTRLLELLSKTQEDIVLVRLLDEPAQLRFRAAAIEDKNALARIVERTKTNAELWGWSARPW